MERALRNAAHSVIESGFDFLDSHVAANGAWPCWLYEDIDLSGTRWREFPPFVAGLGVLALNNCDHAAAQPLIDRTRRFLLSCMQFPGVWSYSPVIPADTDCTAICSLAVGPHPWLRMGGLWGRNLEVILSQRDDEGKFRTRIPGRRWRPGLVNDVDAVVNANVLAYVGQQAETRAARRWIETVVADQREAEDSPNYIEPLDLHFAIARASSYHKAMFSDLRPTLVSRLNKHLSERLDAHAGIRDPMRTAQASSALDMINCDVDEATTQAVVASLIEAQRGDGSWEPCLAWKDPHGLAVWGANQDPPKTQTRTQRGFGSEAITTAFCIEAISRSLRHLRP